MMEEEESRFAWTAKGICSKCKHFHSESNGTKCDAFRMRYLFIFLLVNFSIMSIFLDMTITASLRAH
jgi:hypothetical protein